MKKKVDTKNNQFEIKITQKSSWRSDKWTNESNPYEILLLDWYGICWRILSAVSSESPLRLKEPLLQINLIRLEFLLSNFFPAKIFSSERFPVGAWK